MTDKDYFICPNCGKELPTDAKHCPECGSDDNTGWKDDLNADIPQEYTDEDYENFIQKEFGKKKHKLGWLIIAIIVIIAILIIFTYIK